MNAEERAWNMIGGPTGPDPDPWREMVVDLLAEMERRSRRLEALEEIRQRVADGWQKYRQQHYGPPVYYWFRGNLTHREPMSPEVASLLWPEDT